MLFDSHCHLDDPRLQPVLEAVMARAHSHRVERFMCAGVGRDRWPVQEELAGRYSGIHCAYGIHPWFLGAHELSDLDELEKWLAHDECVAVGECGLDFYPGQSPEPLQHKFFHGQLDLAQQFAKPVVLHARKSLDAIMRDLRLHPGLQGVVHGFAGSAQQARQLVDQGFYLGVGCAITHPQNERLRQVLVDVPLEHLLVETDSPDQPPAGHQGELNEPVHLTRVVRELARLRKKSPAEIGEITFNNARTLFAV